MGQVEAKLLAALPGGLPWVCVVNEDEVWVESYSEEWNEGLLDGVVHLPGPDSLNAAGALRRLAESLGARLDEGEQVNFYQTSEEGCWVIDCCDDEWASFSAHDIVDKQGRQVKRHHIAPTLRPGMARMDALAAVLTWGGLLFEAARLLGWDVPSGTWPEWTLADAYPPYQGKAWTLHILGAECPMVNQGAPAQTKDPTEALRQLVAHLREAKP
ncbi:MAG: hypothetical protein GY788_20965 [bacterium]|nr:hypothetical protein [bacterium]